MDWTEAIWARGDLRGRSPSACLAALQRTRAHPKKYLHALELTRNPHEAYASSGFALAGRRPFLTSITGGGLLNGKMIQETAEPLTIANMARSHGEAESKGMLTREVWVGIAHYARRVAAAVRVGARKNPTTGIQTRAQLDRRGNAVSSRSRLRCTAQYFAEFDSARRTWASNSL